jgi:hypothetical protein
MKKDMKDALKRDGGLNQPEVNKMLDEAEREFHRGRIANDNFYRLVRQNIHRWGHNGTNITGR